MLNQFREALEQLLYDAAKEGIKLTDVSYDVVDVYYYDREAAEGKSVKDIEDLKFKIEVSDG